MGPADGSITERLEHYSMPVTESGCQIWIGGIGKPGYGALNVGNGKVRTAHSLAWENKNGAIPKGVCVLHRCDIRSCINPDHLFLGTRADNVADMDAKGRRKTSVGEDRNTSVLTEEDVKKIRAMNGSQRSIAKMFNVNHATIGAIKRRSAWKHI